MKASKSPNVVTAQVVAKGLCPFCQKPWAVARSVEEGDAVLHELPMCEGFQSTSAEDFLRLAQPQGDPN